MIITGVPGMKRKAPKARAAREKCRTGPPVSEAPCPFVPPHQTPPTRPTEPPPHVVVAIGVIAHALERGAADINVANVVVKHAFEVITNESRFNPHAPWWHTVLGLGLASTGVWAAVRSGLLGRAAKAVGEEASKAAAR